MPQIFQSGAVELTVLQKNPSLQHLLEYFYARTSEWPYPIRCMECFSVGVFYDLSDSFKNERAFALLNLASQFPWDELPNNLFMLGIDLLSELAIASESSEIPEQLSRQWNKLASRTASITPSSDAWTTLSRHFKIN